MLSLLLCNIGCCAQVKASQLVNSSWRYQSGDDSKYDFRITFTKDSIIHNDSFKTLNKSARSSFAYYLSWSKPTSFHNSLIGKTTEGLYIVEYEKTGNRLICYKVTLKDNVLTLTNEDNMVLSFEKQN